MMTDNELREIKERSLIRSPRALDVSILIREIKRLKEREDELLELVRMIVKETGIQISGKEVALGLEIDSEALHSHA